jgi:hypothetical protein
MVVGDSIMQSAEPGLAAALEATGVAHVVYDDAMPGWGLVNHSPTRNLDYDWRSQWPSLIEHYRPELVVGMWTWDDDIAQADPAYYSRVLKQALSILLDRGDGLDGVMLLAVPALDPSPGYLAFYRSTGWTRQLTVSGLEAAGAAWDHLASSVAQQEDGRVVYSTATVAAGTRGRATDGVHFCPAGAVVLGAAVAGQLASLLHLAQPSPGWQPRVAMDPFYAVQPGLCPRPT